MLIVAAVVALLTQWNGMEIKTTILHNLTNLSFALLDYYGILLWLFCIYKFVTRLIYYCHSSIFHDGDSLIYDLSTLCVGRGTESTEENRRKAETQRRVQPLGQKS